MKILCKEFKGLTWVAHKRSAKAFYYTHRTKSELKEFDRQNGSFAFEAMCQPRLEWIGLKQSTWHRRTYRILTRDTAADF